MTDRGEHISTTTDSKLSNYMIRCNGIVHITTLLLPSGYRHEGIRDTGQCPQF